MQLGVLPHPPSPPLKDADASAPAPTAEAGTGVDADELVAALVQLALLQDADGPEEDFEEETQEEEAGSTPYPHLFVVGDAADAFGAVPAGHNAYYQAEIAARNVLQLIRAKEASGLGDEEGEDQGQLERYTPGAPAIKVSLGLVRRFSLYHWHGT